MVYLKKTENQPEISCINLQSSEPEFHFNLDNEKNCQSEFSTPKKYIYIPNNSVLKSGAFNLVSEKFGLKKLHQNTHIYTSEEKIEHFQGRIFETEEINSKYHYFKQTLTSVLNEINNGTINAFLYPGAISYLILNFIYKIDFLIKPEGNILEQINLIHKKFFNDTITSVHNKNK